MDFEKAVKEAPEFRTVEEEFIEFVSPEEIKKPVKTTPGKISKVIKLTSKSFDSFKKAVNKRMEKLEEKKKQSLFNKMNDLETQKETLINEYNSQFNEIRSNYDESVKTDSVSSEGLQLDVDYLSELGVQIIDINSKLENINGRLASIKSGKKANMSPSTISKIKDGIKRHKKQKQNISAIKEEIDDLISEGKYYGLGKKIDAMKDYNFVNSNSAPEPDIPATDEHSKQEEENLPKVDFNFDDVNWYSALGLDNNKNTSSVENSEIKSTGDNLEEPTEVKIDFNSNENIDESTITPQAENEVHTVEEIKANSNPVMEDINSYSEYHRDQKNNDEELEKPSNVNEFSYKVSPVIMEEIERLKKVQENQEKEQKVESESEIINRNIENAQNGVGEYAERIKQSIDTRYNTPEVETLTDVKSDLPNVPIVTPTTDQYINNISTSDKKEKVGALDVIKNFVNDEAARINEEVANNIQQKLDESVVDQDVVLYEYVKYLVNEGYSHEQIEKLNSNVDIKKLAYLVGKATGELFLEEQNSKKI